MAGRKKRRKSTIFSFWRGVGSSFLFAYRYRWCRQLPWFLAEQQSFSRRDRCFGRLWIAGAVFIGCQFFSGKGEYLTHLQKYVGAGRLAPGSSGLWSSGLDGRIAVFSGGAFVSDWCCLFLRLFLVSGAADNDVREKFSLFSGSFSRRNGNCSYCGDNCAKNFIKNRKKAVFFHGVQV